MHIKVLSTFPAPSGIFPGRRRASGRLEGLLKEQTAGRSVALPSGGQHTETDMRKAIALSSLLAALLIAASYAHAQGQMGSSAANSPNNKFCLKQKGETSATNCIYASMEQCKQASNNGRNGDCVANKNTTGSGSSGMSR